MSNFLSNISFGRTPAAEGGRFAPDSKIGHLDRDAQLEVRGLNLSIGGQQILHDIDVQIP